MGTSLSINENWRRFTIQMVATIKQQGGTISFDPNLRPDMLRDERLRSPYLNVLENTDIFLPGEEELQQLIGIKDYRKAAQYLISNGTKIVAVKRGNAGSLIVTEDIELECEAYEVQEVDPTGAGDCYDAGFLKGYFEGWDWEDIGKFANAVGALAVSKRGPMEGISDIASVQRFIQRFKDNQRNTS
jgi:sugar/nucleoside kinase (ribokinase family)